MFQWGKNEHEPKLGQKIQAAQKRGTKGQKHRQWWKDQPQWKKDKLRSKTKKDAFDKKNKIRADKAADDAEEEEENEEDDDGWDGMIPAYWRYDHGGPGPDGGPGNGDGDGAGGGGDRATIVGSTPVVAAS